MVIYREDISTQTFDVNDLLPANAVNGFGSGAQTAAVICLWDLLNLCSWVNTVYPTVGPVLWVCQQRS